MNQQELRKRIKHLHDVFNMPYTLVAHNVNVSSGYIGQWINETKTLSDEKFEEVKKFYEYLISEVSKHNDKI